MRKNEEDSMKRVCGTCTVTISIIFGGWGGNPNLRWSKQAGVLVLYPAQALELPGASPGQVHIRVLLFSSCRSELKSAGSAAVSWQFVPAVQCQHKLLASMLQLYGTCAGSRRPTQAACVGPSGGRIAALDFFLTASVLALVSAFS